MPILAAAVILVAVLCLVVLVLIFAVMRRLREQQAELDKLSQLLISRVTDYDVTELVGRRFPDATGQPVLAGFFSVDCEACHVQAPIFAAEVGDLPTAVIVSGPGAETDPLVAQFSGKTVIAGRRGEELARQLGIRAYPTFVRLDSDGTVVRAQTEAAGLATPVHA